MNGTWLAIGLSVAAAVVALLASWRRGGRATDLGAVSTHWIAEQRFGSDRDSSRR